MAFCSSCGTEIMADAAVCPECGHPQGASPGGTLEYADFWTRFVGALIDTFVVAAGSLVLNFSSLRWFAGFIVGFAYHWLLVAYWNGQTLGRRAMNIRVARPDGTQVDPGTAAGRAAMRIVSGIPLGLGFLWAAWDPERRTWHDMVADTRVYRVR